MSQVQNNVAVLPIASMPRFVMSKFHDKEMAQRYHAGSSMAVAFYKAAFDADLNKFFPVTRLASAVSSTSNMENAA